MGLFGTLPLTRVSFLAFASLQNSRKLSCSYSSTATRLMGINYILKYDYVPGEYVPVCVYKCVLGFGMYFLLW